MAFHALYYNAVYYNALYVFHASRAEQDADAESLILEDAESLIASLISNDPESDDNEAAR